jgi:hypothetical protein
MRSVTDVGFEDVVRAEGRLQALYCNVLGVLYSRWNFIALQKSIHYS